MSLSIGEASNGYKNGNGHALSDVRLGAPLNTNSQMSNTIGKISQALSKAQGELESAKKDTNGYGYNYSDLASVINTAKPVLFKNELAVTQLIGNTNSEQVEVTTILSHASGEFFKSVATLPLPEMKSVNLAQKSGAAISYLRRYTYQAILGMSSEDTDASSQGSNASKKEISTEYKRKTVDTKSEESAQSESTPQKKTNFRRKKKETNDEF